MRQQIPCRLSFFRQRFLVGFVGIRSRGHEPFSTSLLIDRIDTERPSKEFFESRHSRFDFGHEPHQEFPSDDFHRLLKVLFMQLSPELIGQLSRHPVVLHDVGLGVLFQGPLFEFRSVGRFPVRHPYVIEHADGPVDGMSEDGKQPSLGRRREKIVGFVNEGGHHDVCQSGVGESHGLGPLNPRHGGAIYVDEGRAVGVGPPGHARVDDGDSVVSVVSVGDAEFGGLYEAVASSHGVFDGRSSGFGDVPEHLRMVSLFCCRCGDGKWIVRESVFRG